MSLSTAITNQKELLDYLLKKMKPGMVLSGLKFKVIDEKKNQVDLENTTILCRERHSTKKSEKPKDFGYRYEVFNNKHLGMGSFCEVFPVTATLKLNEHHQIEILKKENNKTRIVKVDRSDIRHSCANNETLFGVNIPYLHMKPVIERLAPSKKKLTVNYIVMHKMPGATLDELLENGTISQLNKNRRILLLLSLLQALQNLHQQDLVHRDIKPANIMINFESESLEPQVNIIDFGFCKQKEIQEKIIAWTPFYGAPEAKDGNSCQKSDIFSLGKIFGERGKYGLISDDLQIKNLIGAMTLGTPSKRIPLSLSINKIKQIYEKQKLEESSNLKLSLLLILSSNKTFKPILKKISLSKQKLFSIQQETKNHTTSKDLNLSIFNELEKFKAIDKELDLIEFLTFFGESYNLQLSKTLTDAFKLSIEIDNQLTGNKLNDLRQSIVKAIFTYVQKTYNSHSNDRAGSQRRINNIQTLLVILKNPFKDEEVLKNEILSWNKTIERGCLGNSKLYDLVAEAAGLKRKNTIQSLFWGKSSSAYFTKQQRSVFDPLLCKP